MRGAGFVYVSEKERARENAERGRRERYQGVGCLREIERKRERERRGSGEIYEGGRVCI